jgi:hypothetical protein
MIALTPVYFSVWKEIDRRWFYVSVYYALVCVLQFMIAADVWRLSFYLFPIILTAFVQWLVLIKRHVIFNTQISICIIMLCGMMVLSSSFVLFIFLLAIIVYLENSHFAENAS